MRALLCLFLFVPVLLLGQSSPVYWQVSSVKQGPHLYEVRVSASLSKDWYLYAQTSSQDGLEAPDFHWDNENITPQEPVQALQSPVTTHDALFRKNLAVFRSAATFYQHIKINGTVPATLKLTITAFAAGEGEFLPITESRTVHLEGGIENNQEATVKRPAILLANPVADCGGTAPAKKGKLSIFLLGLLGGLIALLTPCVFPMIPVTVSYFTGKAGNGRSAIANGLIYGGSILLIYLLASLPFHLFGNIDPGMLNSLSTNAWLNLFFFGIFIAFALSFFGVFEFRLPSAFTNSAGTKSSITSFTGIFFMALTLVVVSFSCTGPILGSLLVGSVSTSGGAWELTAGMAGFGLALGLPFALFAIFPQGINRLPRSGAWLETVKKSLAFVELALALKFLSNADLVQHWGLLKREIFIAAWILIAFALAAYLFGWFTPQQSAPSMLYVVREQPPAPPKKRSGGRTLAGVLALLFGLYLLPGLTRSQAAGLSWVSGFPPPLSYSLYKNADRHQGVKPDVINDYNKALRLAKAANKPLLIDFTGWACVNCRKMEEQVWTQPEIRKQLEEKFVLVSLYVDDRGRLPAGQRFTYRLPGGGEKDIATLGDKWATFQSENFAQVTQPLYVILSPGEQLLNHPVGYTPSAKEYGNWLSCGLNAYHALQAGSPTGKNNNTAP